MSARGGDGLPMGNSQPRCSRGRRALCGAIPEGKEGQLGEQSHRDTLLRPPFEWREGEITACVPRGKRRQGPVGDGQAIGWRVRVLV